MNSFLNVLPICVPVFLALILGNFAKQKKLLKREGILGLKAIVVNFTLPAVLIGAFYKTQFELDSLVIVGVIFLSCILALLAGKAINAILKNKQELLPYLTTGFEAGMLGYGLYIMLFSQSNLPYFAVVDIGQVIFVFTLYMALLNAKKGVSKKDTLKNMFKSPIFISILVGLALGISGVGMAISNSGAGATVQSVLDYISVPTGVIMLFVVGYELEWTKNSLKSAFFMGITRLVIMCIICAFALWLISLFITVNYYLFWAVILMFTLPAPFVLPLFVRNETQEGVAATSLSVYTLITMVLFIAIAIIVKGVII